MLDVVIKLVNNGAGQVNILQDQPRGPDLICRASECQFPTLSNDAILLVGTEAGLGTDTNYGGVCAGTVIAPCRVTMNGDQSVIITFTGWGLNRPPGDQGDNQQ
jgi:hypothetical protein